MNLGRAAIMLLLGLALVFLCMTAASARCQDTGARRAVAEGVGMCTLALACDVSCTRNALEGPAACLGEVPGGYCLHNACDVAACPPEAAERTFTLSLAKAER